jgi:hypothetical protein
MLKLCVAIDSVQHLEEHRELFHTKDGTAYHRHITRYEPKRAAEMLDGGSIYWVIKRFVQVRQRIIGFEKIDTDNGVKCMIMMEPKLILTESQPRRPHQGWRYLNAADTPKDAVHSTGMSDEKIPEDMAGELRKLGLL